MKPVRFISPAAVDVLFRLRQVGTLTPQQFMVGMALASFMNKDGCCHPGSGTLAEMCRMDSSQVRRTLRQLEALGFVEVERRLGRSSIYTLVGRDSYTPGRSGCIDPDGPGHIGPGGRGLYAPQKETREEEEKDSPPVTMSDAEVFAFEAALAGEA